MTLTSASNVRRVRRHAQYVDAVMRQVYAATSWDNRIAKIEMAVWDAVEVDRAENERLRSALEVIARHFSSDWPERCQSNVLTARAALTPNVEVEALAEGKSPRTTG